MRYIGIFSDNGTKEPGKTQFWNFCKFWPAWNFLVQFSLLCSGEWALSFYIWVFIRFGVSLIKTYLSFHGMCLFLNKY